MTILSNASAVPGDHDSRKLHDRIAISIGTDIATGLIPEGAILPREAEAIEHFGVSRTAYREAMRVLAGKGLISTRRKAGTIVNSRREWALLDVDVLTWMFARKPTRAAVKSLFELRMIVEPYAARLAAERRTPEQLSAMGHALEEMSRFGLKTEQGRAADGAFHALILDATSNEFLVALTKPITTAIRWTTVLKFEASRIPRNALAIHRDLFSAIADRDGERAHSTTVQLLSEARDDTEAALA